MRPSRVRRALVTGGLLAVMAASNTMAQDLPDWVPGDWFIRIGATWSDPQGDGAKHHQVDPYLSTVEADGDDVLVGWDSNNSGGFDDGEDYIIAVLEETELADVDEVDSFVFA